MKFSVGFLPDYPVEDTLSLIKKADELGFYGFFVADEIYHKDPWQIFSLGAENTKRIRFGPCVTHVYLNDPTMIARSLATLDEISGGRAECTLSIGNVAMLDQYHIDWKNSKPLSRLREAFYIIRMMLKTGKATFNGRSFRYDGLFSFARPKNKVPLYTGSMGGQKSLELGGEIGDGVFVGLGYSEEFWKYAVEKIKSGARMAQRNLDGFEIGDFLYVSISKYSEKAKETSRAVTGFYVSSMPDKQLLMHGIDPVDVKDLKQAFFQGDIKEVMRLTTLEMVDKLSITGTPDEAVDKIEKNLRRTGVNHLAISIIDPFVVKIMTGETIAGSPSWQEQLAMIANKVVPHFGSDS